jgi:hypothetical protein
MDQSIVDKMDRRKHGWRSAFFTSEVNSSGTAFHEASFTIDQDARIVPNGVPYRGNAKATATEAASPTDLC